MNKSTKQNRGGGARPHPTGNPAKPKPARPRPLGKPSPNNPRPGNGIRPTFQKFPKPVGGHVLDPGFNPGSGGASGALNSVLSAFENDHGPAHNKPNPHGTQAITSAFGHEGKPGGLQKGDGKYVKLPNGKWQLKSKLKAEPGGDVWNGKREPVGGWKPGTHGKNYKAPVPKVDPFAAPWLAGFKGGGGWMAMEGGGWFNPTTWQSWKPGDAIPGMGGKPAAGGTTGAATGTIGADDYEKQLYAQLLKAFGGV